jgi:hypothetical protein
MRKFGFARFAEPAKDNAVDPNAADTAAKPAFCKNLRLFNILISCQILLYFT